MKCPCCGGDMPAVVPTTALSAIPMPDSERAILDLAVASYPAAVPTSRIVHALWGRRADGGPMDTDGGIGVRVHRLNKKIKPVGWRVRAVNHSYHGRRLEPLESASEMAVIASPGIRGSKVRPLNNDKPGSGNN